MPLPPVYGHAEARARLASAARSGTLSQSLLIHGPSGVGKERIGLWLAALLLCEAPASEGPCGVCRSCRMVERLEHPDVHWFFPLPRPDAPSPEKLRDKLEEHRAAELGARRANPLHVPSFDKPPAYFLGTIQNLQHLAGMRPAVSRRKVFVVGDAEAMVPQESSPEAANAFLKLLEEPPADTTLILTSSSPGALLPTIRSRVLPVRLLRLARDEVADFLTRETGADAADARAIADAAEGAIGRALRLLPSGGDVGSLEQQRQAARALLAAVTADSAAERIAAAHAVAPAGARGAFASELNAFALYLRDLMAVAAGAPDAVVSTTDAPLFDRIAARPGVHPEGIATAILRVQEARELAAGNVNPQLILATLLRAVRADLAG